MTEPFPYSSRPFISLVSSYEVLSGPGFAVAFSSLCQYNYLSCWKSGECVSISEAQAQDVLPVRSPVTPLPPNPSWCLLSALSLLAMLSGLPPSDVLCSCLHNLQGIPKTRPRGVQHFHWGFGKELWQNPKPRASLMLASVHKDASCAAWAPNGLPHTVSTSSLTKGKHSLQEEQGGWGSGRGWKKREMVKNNN